MKTKHCKLFINMLTVITLLFILSAQTCVFAAGGPLILEIEPNNDFTAATSIPLNQNYEGMLSDKADIDCFMFDITEPGYFSVNWGPGTETPSDSIKGGWNFGLYDKNHKTIRTATNVKTVQTIDNLFYEAGRYYIEVKKPGSGSLPTDRYLVRANFTKLSPEEYSRWAIDNCENSIQTMIQNGLEYSGTISRTSNATSGDNILDQDIFIMDTATSGVMSVSFYMDDSAQQSKVKDGWRLIIADSAGKTLKNYVSKSGKSSDLQNIAYNGQFSISVKGYSSSYYPIDQIYHIKVTVNPLKTSVPEGEAGKTDPAILNQDGDIVWMCDKIGHDWSTTRTNPATLTEDGKSYQQCLKCSEEKIIAEYPAPAEFVLSGNTYTYTGSSIKPEITVKDKNGEVIPSAKYRIEYADNTNPGTASATVTFNDAGYSGSKTLNFIIEKESSILKAVCKKKNYSVGYKKIKKAKQVIAIDKIISISDHAGTIKYKKVSGEGRIKVSSLTGDITVPKGLKKGTYNIRLKIYDPGNEYYNAGSKEIKFNIIVK